MTSTGEREREEHAIDSNRDVFPANWHLKTCKNRQVFGRQVQGQFVKSISGGKKNKKIQLAHFQPTTSFWGTGIQS